MKSALIRTRPHSICYIPHIHVAYYYMVTDNMRGLVIRDIYQEDLTCDPPVIDTANEEDVNVRASEGSDVTISVSIKVISPIS